MTRIETGKAIKDIVNYRIDDIGISGLPVKLDLYNETANTWFTGSVWQASKPTSLTMTDDGAKFNGRYYYAWTPNLDGYYVAFSYCVSGGFEFEHENDYEAVTFVNNVQAISGTITTVNTNVNTANTNILALSGTLKTVDSNVNTISGNINTANANILTISGNLNTANTNILALSGTLKTVDSRTTSMQTVLNTVDSNVVTICADIEDDVFLQLDTIEDLVRSFANIGSISADILSGGIYEQNVIIKDIDINGTDVYVVYQNVDGKLKVVQTPFNQGVIIASGVGL